MLNFLAQATTQPTTQFNLVTQGQLDHWITAGIAILTAAIIGFGGVGLLAISWYAKLRAAWRETKQQQVNLASTVKDIGTDAQGRALPNVSPETLPTLNNIISGTGDGTTVPPNAKT